MSRPVPTDEVSMMVSKRRRLLFWLSGLTVVVLVAALIGTIYESAAEAAEARAYPPPGQFVDVGGYRLHLSCTGAGSPTVVIDAGLGDWSTSWAGVVQPDVAKTTRICTYDRAGLGWSEAGALPRTAQQFDKELHVLLTQANVPGPYVLVGHSMGGFTMRVFTHDYPTDVAGVVLIESMTPAQFPASTAVASTQTSPASQLHTFSLLPLLARIGVIRLLARLLDLTPASLPNEKAYTTLFVRPQTWQTMTDESQGLPDSAGQAATVTSFGNLPLVILSRGLGNTAADQVWQENQTRLLQLSTNSKQLFATQSGHNVELDQPEAAVGAIVTVVETVRRLPHKK